MSSEWVLCNHSWVIKTVGQDRALGIKQGLTLRGLGKSLSLRKIDLNKNYLLQFQKGTREVV